MNEKTQRRTVPKKGYPGIYDIEVYDSRRNRWIEPMRDNKFQVVKYVDGRRVKRNFDSFDEAKKFRHSSEPMLEEKPLALQSNIIQPTSEIVVVSPGMTF